MVDDMIERIKSEPSLLSGDRNELFNLASTQKTQLSQHKQSNKQKTSAIEAATTEMEKIAVRINAVIAIRGQAFATFNKAREEQAKNIFAALRKEAEEAGIRSDDVPILEEWDTLMINAERAIRAAQDAQSAERNANAFEIDAMHLAGNAGTSRGKIASDLRSKKKEAEDKQAFRTLMAGIAKALDKLEVLTGDIDQDSLLTHADLFETVRTTEPPPEKNMAIALKETFAILREQEAQAEREQDWPMALDHIDAMADRANKFIQEMAA